jgi:hypothetical protein
MQDIKPGYTRVSEILSQWDRFGNIDPEVLKRKAALGIYVHEAIHADNEGIYAPLSEKAEPYFESYLKWKKLMKPSYIWMEKRFYDDTWMITGQIDGLLKTDIGSMIIDFKTSASASPKYWILQAGFYHMLYSQIPVNQTQDYLCSNVIFLQLDKYGDMPQVHKFEITRDVIDTCKSCVRTYRHFNS